MECIYCQRVINNKGSLVAHQNYCKLNPNKKIKPPSKNSGVKKGNVPWNKGKIGVQEAWNKGIKGSTVGRCLDEKREKDRRKKLSLAAKKRNFGGYVQGSGRGKKGWYKGFFCDSSWELAYVIYCLDHNITIKRNTEKRSYTFNNKVKNYIPDFIVNNELVEIKGYKTKEWEAKLRDNPDVKVLYEEDLTNIFDYVISKYTKDYTNLYEDTQES